VHNLSSSNVKNLALFSFGASPISSPIDPHEADNSRKRILHTKKHKMMA
jgi:hypothetical protein